MSKLLDFTGVTMPLGNYGLTDNSGTKTTFDANQIFYAIDGKTYGLTSARADATTGTTDYVTGAAITLTANKARLVVWCLTTTATDIPKLIAGPAVDMDNGTMLTPPQFPAIPAGLCPVAYMLVKAGATTSGTWTFGSSNWDATGVTNTTVNICGMANATPTS